MVLDLDFDRAVLLWQVRIIGYDKSKKRLSLSMKQWTEAAPKDETDDIKNYVDPVIVSSSPVSPLVVLSIHLWLPYGGNHFSLPLASAL